MTVPSTLGLVERSIDANSMYVLFGLKSLGYLVFRTRRSFSVDELVGAIDVIAETIEVIAEVFELIEVTEANELAEVVNVRLVVVWVVTAPASG